MSDRNAPARAWTTFLQAGGMWLERNAFVRAGSLAFYTLFSMAPVVIIAVAVAGAVFGEEAARGRIVTQLDDVVGHDAAQAVQDAVARSRPDVAGNGPSVTGLLALFIGATTVFAQMQISLNRIWGVASKPQRSGVLIFVKNRMLSLAIILTIGFILLVSLLLNVALRAVIEYAEGWILVPPLFLSGLELVSSLVIITVLFAVIFKVLPDAVIAWRDVWVGAATTTVYYSSLILFFGAALTKARVLMAGGRVVPRAMAVRVREEIVEE